MASHNVIFTKIYIISNKINTDLYNKINEPI